MANDSILNSVKKALGPDETYTHFDPDILMHINSALAVLTQLGVGPKEGFVVEDSSITWKDFLQDDKRLSLVKSYVFMRVKLLFDSSTMSSSAISAMEAKAQEFEWRITTIVDELQMEGGNQNG